MQLTKRYEELIERDASEISILWKILQVFFYLVNAVAGYATTYGFYIFQSLFRQQCVLWAKPQLKPNRRVSGFDTSNDFLRAEEKPWQNRLRIKSSPELYCTSIRMISILSCACGIIGFSFFFICGKGGYNVRTYFQSWRLVCPAITFNFFMSLLTLQMACNFDNGFEYFQYNLNKLLNRTGIEPMVEYLQAYNEDDYQLLEKYVKLTKISSWAGTAAWIMGFALLILRVVNVTDFRLLKVSVYTPVTRTEEPRHISLDYEPGVM